MSYCLSHTVYNPANGAEIGEMSDLTADDTKPAVDAAYEAFKTWSKTPAKVCPFCVFVLWDIKSPGFELVFNTGPTLIEGLLGLLFWKKNAFQRFYRDSGASLFGDSSSFKL